MSDHPPILDRLLPWLRIRIEECRESTDPEVVAVRTSMEGDLQELQDLQTALAQATELAIHVEASAKGSLEKEARRFLSVPYAVTLQQRLQHSVLLNRVLWRMLEALGEVAEPDTQHVGDPEQVIERFFATR